MWPKAMKGTSVEAAAIALAKLIILPALGFVSFTFYQNQLTLARFDQRMLGVEQSLAKIETKLDLIYGHAKLKGPKADRLDTAYR